MKKIIALAAIVAAPAVAFAQLGNITSLVNQISNIITLLIPVAFAAALLFFFWGLAQYIMAGGDETTQKAGKDKMLWGVIALFVMSSIWGIV
ncbi:MAG: hypothetical protein AAB587_02065, partial [Patescibacteria group bacterium]